MGNKANMRSTEFIFPLQFHFIYVIDSNFGFLRDFYTGEHMCLRICMWFLCFLFDSVTSVCFVLFSFIWFASSNFILLFYLRCLFVFFLLIYLFILFICQTNHSSLLPLHPPLPQPTTLLFLKKGKAFKRESTKFGVLRRGRTKALSSASRLSKASHYKEWALKSQLIYHGYIDPGPMDKGSSNRPTCRRPSWVPNKLSSCQSRVIVHELLRTSGSAVSVCLPVMTLNSVAQLIPLPFLPLDSWTLARYLATSISYWMKAL